ncbi:extracellular solute-binding protein [Neobacillus sp. 179-C4.2 HS]|uniref:Extracellular solute-binding protein n=1 Tax=Neobacillus driksii TaxID=3035913 RepID=A0ABV4YTE7_9BACI|nr:extracellular solute-binding protein [Neobacillus sp. 179.-C4.2 HS]MDP5194294.1 extracellular solute-binding protein [Neobacillus sp. 179.-C4.2 HS]
MNKYIHLSIVLLILFVTIGCSKETDKTVNDNSQEHIKLDIAIHVANPKGQEPAFYWIVQRFMEKYPDIKIELHGTEQKAHIKKIKMMAQSDSLPDIFWVLPSSAKELAEAGFLLDLKPFLNNHPEMVENLHLNMLDSYSLDGQQFGLPYQSLVTGIWYNKAIFEKNNLKLPETYDGLKSAVQTLHENNIIPIAKGANDPYSVWAFLTMLSRYGYFEKIDSILAGNESFNNEDFLNFYRKIAELRELGAFPKNVATQSYFQAVQMFLNGEAAMLDAGIWETKKIEESSIAGDVGFWWGPTFTDGVGNQKISSIVPAAPLVVNKHVEKDKAKYEAAMKFLGFYFSEEGASIMIENQVAPIMKFDGEIDSDLHPVFANVMNVINDTSWESKQNQPDLIVSEGIANAMYDSIYGVINGIYSPEEAIKIVDSKIAR